MSPGSISSWPGDEKAQKTNLPASSWRGPKEEKEGKDFTSNQIALDGRKESNEIPQTTSVPWLDYHCALSFNPAAHSGQPLRFAAPPSRSILRDNIPRFYTRARVTVNRMERVSMEYTIGRDIVGFVSVTSRRSLQAHYYPWPLGTRHNITYECKLVLTELYLLEQQPCGSYIGCIFT